MTKTYLPKSVHCFLFIFKPFSLHCSVSLQVPRVVIRTYGTKRSWNYPPLMLNLILVHYVLRLLIHPRPKRFCSHRYHTLSIPFYLRPLLGRFQLYGRAIVLLYHLAFSIFWEATKLSPTTGWGVVDFLTVIYWTEVSSTQTTSTFML